MTASAIKKWFLIHRYSSLICTVFLLVLCITGLPLIFGDEIDQWLSNEPSIAAYTAGKPLANLDSMVNISRNHYPKQVVSYVFIDDEQPQVQVNMLPAYGVSPVKSHSLKFDAYTGKLLKDARPKREEQGFTSLMLDIHQSLFLGLGGEMFLALMGVLFVAALVSGAMLYGPFMRKLDFGTVRQNGSKRLKWLDLHNLLGIATLLWMTVVGITGIMNELSTPLFGAWQANDVANVVKHHNTKPITNQVGLSSVQASYDSVKRALPGHVITSIVFPGHAFSSPSQYLIWTKGNHRLTGLLFYPALVDARAGRLSAVVNMPWYLRLLEVSRPLHFGDYGGMPLKVIWAAFDLLAIIVLVSGIYLWLVRRKIYVAYFQSIEIK